ncbi:MAG: MazG nucleotide pyrophosphohydrolase domain-containing protein [Planctomycetaceae bacterium]
MASHVNSPLWPEPQGSQASSPCRVRLPHRLMLFDKLQEELAELHHELSPEAPLPIVPASVEGDRVNDESIDDPARQDRIEDELGDVLFVMANIARRWGINPEEALRRSNRKFSERFQAIERGLAAEGKHIQDATLVEMEEHYQQAKRHEASQ